MENKEQTFLNRLNQQIKPTPKHYNYKNINDIPKNQEFDISNIFRTTTQYGNKIAADLSYCVINKTHEFRTYLPDRFINLADDDLQDINESEFKLIYKGKNDDGVHVLEFNK
jgi:hypothetical protein